MRRRKRTSCFERGDASLVRRRLTVSLSFDSLIFMSISTTRGYFIRGYVYDTQETASGRFVEDRGPLIAMATQRALLSTPQNFSPRSISDFPILQSPQTLAVLQLPQRPGEHIYRCRGSFRREIASIERASKIPQILKFTKRQAGEV
jgi:hypothetical protein